VQISVAAGIRVISVPFNAQKKNQKLSIQKIILYVTESNFY
jgi:hypothetical protein